MNTKIFRVIIIIFIFTRYLGKYYEILVCKNMFQVLKSYQLNLKPEQRADLGSILVAFITLKLIEFYDLATCTLRLHLLPYIFVF